MIKALACLYRYGPLVVLIPLMLQHYAVAGMLILFFSIWNAYGYKKNGDIFTARIRAWTISR